MFLKGRIAHVSSGIAPLWLKNWGWTTSVRSLSIDMYVGSMVCNKPSITSTTCVSHVDRQCSHHPCSVRPWSWDLLGSWPVDADAHSAYCVKMFCCPAWAATDSSLVPAATFQTLMVTLVHSRLNYGNSVLVGIPVYLMRRLQSVLNAAARLIFHLRRSDHRSEQNLRSPCWPTKFCVALHPGI